MPFTHFSVVKHRLRPGSALPFNVRDADGVLLLAKGLTITDPPQFDELLDRGALVDLAEVHIRRDDVREAARKELPALWSSCTGRLAQTLLQSTKETFRAALDEAAEPVAALVERDPDLAIFQVLRQEGSANVQYGLDHSVHTAIVSRLVGQRLGWDEATMVTAFKASLTMNLSMLELQGELAVSGAPPTDAQRRIIHEHPLRSVQMLELAGVTDRDWLRAVAEHHEAEDGSGYPSRTRAVCEIASLIRRADIYTAKLSPRAGRDARAADEAGREMFMRDPGNPMTAALVKEFGVYPPGCFVQLVSGEIGLVVQRGPTVTTPVVVALATQRGAPLPEPVRRETSNRQYAVAGIVPPHCLRAMPKREELAGLVSA